MTPGRMMQRQMASVMRIVLADDQARVRSALSLLIDQENGFLVVGEAEDAQSMLVCAQRLHPDLVLMDWELPGLDEAHKLNPLCAAAPGVKVIALSGQPDKRGAALKDGAIAFVAKTDPPDVLLAALYFAHGEHESQVRAD